MLKKKDKNKNINDYKKPLNRQIFNFNNTIKMYFLTDF